MKEIIKGLLEQRLYLLKALGTINGCDNKHGAKRLSIGGQIEDIDILLYKNKQITYKEIDQIKEENEKGYSAFEALVERLKEEGILSE